MYLTLEKAYGVVDASPSKSHLIRLLFLSYMSENDSFITLPLAEICGDVKDAMNCAGIFGKSCEIRGKTINITKCAYKNDCFVSGSASVLRFLLACGSVLGYEFSVKCGDKLLSRPHGELISVLNSHGADIKQTEYGFEVSGKAQSGEYIVSAAISSQYASALLLSLPFADGDSVLHLDGKTASLPYIKMTLSALEDAGISIKNENNAFYVKGNNSVDKINAVCEGDWSSAAVFLCMGAADGSVRVNGISYSSLQGDKKICDILVLSGASVRIDENGVTASKGTNKAFDADITDIPDLAQTLAAYAVFCDGTTRLENVSRLKYKESDRAESITRVLTLLGEKAERENDDIKIEKGVFVPDRIDCENDHRTAFMLALLSARGKIGLFGEECVTKSCPSFFEKFKSIGGIVS